MLIDEIEKMVDKKTVEVSGYCTNPSIRTKLEKKWNIAWMDTVPKFYHAGQIILKFVWGKDKQNVLSFHGMPGEIMVQNAYPWGERK